MHPEIITAQPPPPPPVSISKPTPPVYGKDKALMVDIDVAAKEFVDNLSDFLAFGWYDEEGNEVEPDWQYVASEMASLAAWLLVSIASNRPECAEARQDPGQSWSHSNHDLVRYLILDVPITLSPYGRTAMDQILRFYQDAPPLLQGMLEEPVKEMKERIGVPHY